MALPTFSRTQPHQEATGITQIRPGGVGTEIQQEIKLI
jgi:hypothetical protein